MKLKALKVCKHKFIAYHWATKEFVCAKCEYNLGKLEHAPEGYVCSAIPGLFVKKD